MVRSISERLCKGGHRVVMAKNLELEGRVVKRSRQYLSLQRMPSCASRNLSSSSCMLEKALCGLQAGMLYSEQVLIKIEQKNSCKIRTLFLWHHPNINPPAALNQISVAMKTKFSVPQLNCRAMPCITVRKLVNLSMNINSLIDNPKKAWLMVTAESFHLRAENKKSSRNFVYERRH